MSSKLLTSKRQDMLKKINLSLIFLTFLSSFAANFKHPNNKKVSYIFSPGIISCQTQAAKYFPYFLAENGEKISCTGGIHILNDPITICLYPEIVKKSLKDEANGTFSFLGHFITGYFNRKYGIDVLKEQNPSSDYTLENHSFDISKINLGQTADVDTLYKTYNEHIEKYPDTCVIMQGTSRGAAAAAICAAKYNLPNLKALILEAPFDEIDHMLKHNSIIFNNKLVKKFLPKITSYDPNGDSPLKSASHMPKDIPILIITSKADSLIHHHCGSRLHRHLVKLGYDKVHLLVLERSSHSGYAYDDPKDKEKYESVVHAFYKHYDLPHDENLAHLGTTEWQKILKKFEK